MVDLKIRTKTEMIFITKISLQLTANIQITCSGGVGVLLSQWALVRVAAALWTSYFHFSATAATLFYRLFLFLNSIL